MNSTLWFLVKAAGIVGVIALAQLLGCMTFDEDEWKRIVYTVIGWGAVEGGVAAGKRE